MAIIYGTSYDDNNTYQNKISPPYFSTYFPQLNGTSGDDSLYGLSGFDYIDGGAGADFMDGGDQSDTYIVDNIGDIAYEAENYTSSGEQDLVLASVSFNLGYGLEYLTLTGVANINGTGNSNHNVIHGNAGANMLWGSISTDTTDAGDSLFGEAGNDYLDGGAGADFMHGGDQDDTYVVDDIGDRTLEDWDNPQGGVDTVNSSVSFTLDYSIENLNLTGSAAINGTGNEINNVITGNLADNSLNGGLGADILWGGDGNDGLWGASSTDTTDIEDTLHGQGGIDSLFGVYGNDWLDGGDGNDWLWGDAGNDYLDGGTGADYMSGGDQDDSYIVDDSGDLTLEADNSLQGGVDTVYTYVNRTLDFGFENLNLMGYGSINGTGNENHNVINGNSAANTLDGGLGADTMNGGDQDDIYIVDNSGDVVFEYYNDALGGVDIVNASVSFGPLGYGIENLNLTGTANINGTGNDNNNVINGNSGNNKLLGGFGHDILNGGDGNDTLDGGAGADSMDGGLGNDIYIVDSVEDVVNDVINKIAGAGIDKVNSSVSYALSANVENLTLTGTAAISGIGNTWNNILTGNAANNTLFGADGNDTLNGGAGADAMDGGLGNDNYKVDNVSDTVSEAAGSGTDKVTSSISYTLGANIENLTLAGAAALNGIGNTLNNTLTGNNANNILKSGSGNDVIVGSGGHDTLSGEAGADYFDFNALTDSVVGVNHDMITDFSHAQLDKIDLASLDANIGMAGNQAFVYIGGAAFSSAGQLRFDAGTGILQANVGGTLAADFEIGMLGVSALVVADFVL